MRITSVKSPWGLQGFRAPQGCICCWLCLCSCHSSRGKAKYAKIPHVTTEGRELLADHILSLSHTQGAAGESELSSPEPQEPARALCEAAQLRAWGPVPLQASQVAGKNPLSANILPVRELCVLSSIILPKPPFQILLNPSSLGSNFPALGDNQGETNTNHSQKCLHASLVEGRRGRKETLGSKKEVLKLEESCTHRDHTPPPPLGIN